MRGCAVVRVRVSQWLRGFSRSCLDHHFRFSAPENVRTSQRRPSAEGKEGDNPAFLRSDLESAPVLDEYARNSGRLMTFVGNSDAVLVFSSSEAREN